MRNQPQAAADAALPAAKPRRRRTFWVAPAPRPELPDVRDRKGAQLGLMLAITAAALFWLAVGAAIYIAYRG